MQKKFKCPKCDRSFSMPAHLARHLNTIHGKKKGKKKVARKKRPKAKAKRKVRRPKRAAKKKVGRPRGRTAGRRKTAGTATSRLLSKMAAHRRGLLAQRQALEAQIKGLTRAMQALRGA
jgi:hypothetical protein